jgi:hypothetical protein
VQGVPWVDMDIRIGAELPDETGDPDVIVTQIPYLAGEERDAVGILDRVGDAAVRMTTDRFAVVLGPAAVLAGDLPPFSAAARGLIEGTLTLAGGDAGLPVTGAMGIFSGRAVGLCMWLGRPILPAQAGDPAELGGAGRDDR